MSQQPNPSRCTSTKLHLLRGKTAIITGGTTGIGRAIALGYVRHGANVLVNHLGLEKDKAQLTSLLHEASALKAADAQAGTLEHLAGDVREAATATRLVAAAASAFGGGRVDICVSNAGICTFAHFLELPRDLYEATVRTNLDGAFFVVQAAARHMSRQEPPGGSIIGVSSVSALVGGAAQTHYTPTKAGVLSLMQSCACALGRFGIRCNALLPGTIRTQLNEHDLVGDKEAHMRARVPLGRLGEPDDLVGPAVFLACDDLSGYVNGAQLLVDGGMFVHLQ